MSTRLWLSMLCTLWLCAAVYGAAPAARWTATVLRVIDGDSLRVRVQLWPGQALETEVRLLGIDAPESTWRAKCPRELLLAKQAKDFLGKLLPAGAPITLEDVAADKYGGRWLATVWTGPTTVQSQLIEHGFAGAYTGQGPKPNWCAGEGSPP